MTYIHTHIYLQNLQKDTKYSQKKKICNHNASNIVCLWIILPWQLAFLACKLPYATPCQPKMFQAVSMDDLNSQESGKVEMTVKHLQNPEKTVNVLELLPIRHST